MSYNIEMQYYDGSEYQVLNPKTNLNQISDWTNSIYSKTEVDSKINTINSTVSSLQSSVNSMNSIATTSWTLAVSKKSLVNSSGGMSISLGVNLNSIAALRFEGKNLLMPYQGGAGGVGFINFRTNDNSGESIASLYSARADKGNTTSATYPNGMITSNSATILLYNQAIIFNNNSNTIVSHVSNFTNSTVLYMSSIMYKGTVSIYYKKLL